MQARSLQLLMVFLVCVSLAPLNAQVTGSTVSTQSVSVPSIVRFSGKLPARDGSPRVAGVTFALYRDQQGGSPLWLETQNVSADPAGAYSVLLGSATRGGIPAELFSTGEPRWLGISVEGQELPRILLVSVPYALKAASADTLAGLPAAAFMLNPSFITTRSGNLVNAKAISNGISASLSGTGTTNKIPKWLDSNGTLGDSIIYDTGTKIGINNTNPVGFIDVFTDQMQGYIVLTPFNINLWDKGFLVRASRGSKGSPAAVVQSDNLFNLYAQGYFGSGYGISGGVAMTVDGPVSNTDKIVPGRIEFHTTSTSTLYVERMRIDSQGNVGIGTKAPTSTLDVAGTIHTTSGVKFNDNTVQTTAGVTQTFADGRYLQLTGGTLTGPLTATSFSGDGSGLTNIVSAITAGTGITASGSTGNVTVSLNQTYTDGRYAKLSGGNSLVGNQAVTGNVTTTGAVTAAGLVTGNAVNSSTKYELAGNTILSTLGSGNLFIGTGVDPVNTSGHDNTMAGSVSGNSNTTGYSNSFYGSLSGYSNVDGYYNTFLGEAAGYNNISSHENTMVGFVAGYSNTTGNGNTLLGSNAGYYNTAGINNTYLGYLAAGSVNNAGSENIYIGHNAGTSAPAENNAIRLGDPANISKAFVAGVFGTTVGGDGIAVVVDSNGQLGTIVSSRRFKENIRPMANLSSGLLKLKPVAFYYKPDVDKSANRLLQYGLIAEDVAKVFPDLVVYDKEGKPFTIKYQYLTPMLLNELQKQHEVIVAQQQQTESQQEEIKSLQNRLDRLERLLKEKTN